MPPVREKLLWRQQKTASSSGRGFLHYTTERHREELNSRAMGIVQEIAPFLFREKVAIFTGVDTLLKSIAETGSENGSCYVHTAQTSRSQVLALKKAGLDVLFQTVITADDVSRNKPAPDPLLACAEKMGVAAKDCLYIGDMRVDIRAGRAAGMTTVGVLTGFDDYQSLESMDPHLILESVTALKERLIF